MYQTIGIICAMDKEFALIRDALSHGQTEKVGLLTFYVAEQNGKKIVAAVSGIGKVNAACCAGVTPESHQNALNAMAMCQIEILPAG